MKAKWTVTKFKDRDGKIYELLRSGAKVEDVVKLYPDAFISRETTEGNVALREGLYLLTGIISGIDTTSAKWDAANARIGVGNSTTPEDSSQTGLLGTNKAFKGMDTGYPQRAASETASPQFVRWRATFGGNEANFAWNEFTVVNASDDTGKNLNRKVVSKGTKSSGETWTVELEIQFS